ncbi:MAG: hypothetical protein AB1472_04890, partial [Candidatus Omnitrophota bacterium]
MRVKYIFGVGIFFIISIFGVNNVFSQIVKEEKAEKILDVTKPQKLPPSYKLATSASTYYGFDSNANLDTSRKSDSFEEGIFSLDFLKKLTDTIKFTFFYDLDVINYNHFTYITNLLNHLQFGLHKNISTFTLGAAYDLSLFYYPNSDDDFIFNKGIFYVKQSISKDLTHKLQFEIGLKDYTHRKALDDSLIIYQDKDRQDDRLSVEYGIRSHIKDKLTIGYKTRFSVNDSNAKYLDFYDYKSYENSLRADYELSKDLFVLSN